MRISLLVLLSFFSSGSIAQRGILPDSINDMKAPVSAEILKANGIRYVREYRWLWADSFLSRIFLIDTLGHTVKSTGYGTNGRIGHVDSMIYDGEGRTIAEFSYNIHESFMLEFHYRYPAKDSVESSGYNVMADKSVDSILSYTRLNSQQKPVETKATGPHSNPLTTTVYNYNENGSIKEVFTVNHRDPRWSYGYTYHYRQRETILREKQTGANSVECKYNKLGQCTGCAIFTGDQKNIFYDFRYNNSGLLLEVVEERYSGGRFYTNRRRFHYTR